MEQHEALEQIRLIRDTMNKASQKIFFSPWQWIDWGIVVIIGGLITHWLLAMGEETHIFMVWIAVFIIGGTLEGVVWILDAQRRGIDPFHPFILKIWGVLGCILIPALIFTIPLIQLDHSIYVVGLWLITIGAAMLALVLLGERKELLLFSILMITAGVLSVSILVDIALHIGILSFGVGGFLMGLYMRFKEKRQSKKEG